MSGCVALRLALPGGVVTWFVTGFRISLEQRSVLHGNRNRRRLRHMAVRIVNPYHLCHVAYGTATQ